jgi:hypothetical protein
MKNRLEAPHDSKATDKQIFDAEKDVKNYVGR